jgi:hypothetical protein
MLRGAPPAATPFLPSGGAPLVSHQSASFAEAYLHAPQVRQSQQQQQYHYQQQQQYHYQQQQYHYQQQQQQQQHAHFQQPYAFSGDGAAQELGAQHCFSGWHDGYGLP